MNKILTKLDPYLIKKTHIIDIYSKEGIYQVSENQTYKMYIKSEKNHRNIVLYQRRFETAPLRGAIVQTVTGNLVEVSSAERIEIFNGVNVTNDTNITLVIDDSVIEKEPVYQLPYDHINIPLIIQRYSLNKNTKNTKNMNGIVLVIEFIDNTTTNENAMPINYYFEYNSQNGDNIPVEDINVFLSLLN